MAVEGTAPVFFLRPCRVSFTVLPILFVGAVHEPPSRPSVSGIPRSPATIAAFGRWDFSHASGVVEMTSGVVHPYGAWAVAQYPSSRFSWHRSRCVTEKRSVSRPAPSLPMGEGFPAAPFFTEDSAALLRRPHIAG